MNPDIENHMGQIEVNPKQEPIDRPLVRSLIVLGIIGGAVGVPVVIKAVEAIFNR